MKIHIHYDLNAFMGIVVNCFVADNNMILRSGDSIELPALDKPIQFLSEIRLLFRDASYIGLDI